MKEDWLVALLIDVSIIAESIRRPGKHAINLLGLVFEQIVVVGRGGQFATENIL
jgi:hypothetical protein